VCVCPAACRRTHISYHPKIWRGLLISPGLGTELGGHPKCWPPGVPPILTLSEIPWRVKDRAGASKQKLLLGVCSVKFYFWGAHPNLGPAGSTQPNGGVCFENWAGASKQKLLLGVGLPDKILFFGAHPHPWPAGSTQPNVGVCFENWAGASKQKLLLRVGLPDNILFFGAHPQPGPAGSTPPKGGICIDNFAGAIKQKLLFGVGLHSKIIFVGGLPQPRAPRVHSTKLGYMHWELREGQQTKVALRCGFAL
jgi:hypothetical protein